MGTPAYVLKVRDRLADMTPFLPGETFVLLVTGSREAEPGVWLPVIRDTLQTVNDWLEETGNWGGVKREKILRHGGSKGIDTLAHALAPRFGYRRDRMYADWGYWGRRSGIIRNAAMVDKQPKPHLCLAYFASISRGTADCAGQARAAHIPTVSLTVEDLYVPHAD